MTVHSRDDDRLAFEQVLEAWKRRHSDLSPEAHRQVAKAFETFMQALEDAASSSLPSVSIPVMQDTAEAARSSRSSHEDAANSPMTGRELEQICLDTLSVMCHRLAETFGFPLVWIGRDDGDGTLTILAVAGSRTDIFTRRAGDRWPRSAGHHPIERALHDRTWCLIHHHAEGDEGKVLRAISARSGLVLPLTVRGQVLGVLVLYSTDMDLPEPEIRRWLEMVATQASTIVLTVQHSTQMSLQGVAMASVDQAVCITNEHGDIQWANIVYSQLTECSIEALIGTPVTRYWPVDVVAQWPRALEALHTGSRWTVEFVHARRDGTTYAVEQVITPLVNHQSQVTHFVVMCRDITTQKKQHAEMAYLAHHDPLTRLPNRVLFHDRLLQALAQARRAQRLVAVVFVDLDQFKAINDAWGHAVGDEVLKLVGHRLCRCVRATDTVARRSGDEFTLILQGLEHADDATLVAKKILACLAEPFQVNHHTVSIRASLGIAVFPVDASDPDRLVWLADCAMYRAKRRGGHGWYLASDLEKSMNA